MNLTLNAKECLFSCSICTIEYDLDSHKPLSLDCGHTICAECVKDITKAQRVLKCPFHPFPSSSEEEINGFPINYTLMDIIEERQRLRNKMCAKHPQQIKDIFCLTDKEVICAYCGISETHSGHKMKPVEELEEQCATKIKRLEDLVQEFSRYPEEMSQIFEKPRKKLERLITEVFWQISNMLAKQKEQFLIKVQKLYDLHEYEKDHIEAYIEHSDIMTELKERIQELKDRKFDDSFIEMFERPEPTTPLKMDFQKLKMESQDLDLHISRQIEKCAKIVIDKIKEMDCIDFHKVSWESSSRKNVQKEFCLPINSTLFEENCEELKLDTEPGFDFFFPKLSEPKKNEKRTLMYDNAEIDDSRVYSEYLR